MTDRRQRLDRRAEPCHGRRKDYQNGCRCTRCRGAEAAYRQALRLGHAKGDAGLVPMKPLWQLLRHLIRQYESQAEVARRLGLQKAALQFHTDRVRRTTASKITELWTVTTEDGPDVPEAALNPLNSLNSPSDATRR